MDVVITYVNCNENFIQEYEKYVQKELEVERYRSYDTLDLQIKLIRKYLSFVKNIFVVVSNKEQVEGIDTSDAIIITHEDIMPSKYLPCFNSCTIEMFFHKIPNLSEEFIYFNDDVFPIDYLKPTDFFIYHKPLYNPKTYTLEKDNDKLYLFNLNNSTVLAAKILRKESDYKDKYIKYAHSTIPLLKSSYELTWQFERNQILSSLTRTRHRKNYNTTLFNNYNYLLDKFIHKDIRSTYLNLASGLDKIIDTILYKPTPIVCINDVGEYSFEFDTFKKELRKAFEMNLLDTQPKKEIVKKEEPKNEESKKQNSIVQTIKNISNSLFNKEIKETKEEIKKGIKEEIKEEIKEIYKEEISITDKIVVSFTSWKKRINYCKACVENLFKQSVKPDLIYLNLSVEEFPNKENDLPKDLVELSNTEESFIINWVDGKNTKTMKKIFPILQYLNDEDIIINIDDDMLIPQDLIKSRLEDFNKYGRNFAISSNFRGDWCFCKIPNGEKIWTCACASLMQKKMLNNFDAILTKKIIETYTDDCVYSILAYINGYKFERCSDYARQTGTEHRIFEEADLQDSALRNSNGYKLNSEVVEIFEKDFFRKYHIHLCNAFNYFRKKIIVSLTSYPKRTNNIEIVKCIESIINQTLKPDKIILYLTSSQYPNKLKDIPQYLLNFYKSKSIDIQFRNDIIKPHTKWFYAFQEYPNDLVITVDDDIIYPNDLFESLYDEWKNNQNCIIASRCHIMTYANGRASKYKKFIQYKTLNHSYKLYNENLFLTGVGGVLYNVSLFNKEKIFNIDLIKNTYLTVDDVYLNKIIKEQQIPIICINKYNDYAVGDTVLQGLNETGLWVDNLKNVNDIAIYESKFKENNPINICYITDDNYIPLTIFSIETLISKISNNYQYNIFILHTGKPVNIKFTKKNLHIINIKVDLEHILPENIIENRNDVIKHVTTTALIKFAIPSIFQNLSKILYIDGDIVINDDISKIFNDNIDEYSIGAVADDIEFESYELWDKCFRNMHNTSIYFKIHDKCIKENGFYFNSGVILFNLKKLRKTNITEQLIEYKSTHKTTFVDQDTFNLVLGNNTKKLSKFYNYFFRYGDLKNKDIVAIHVAEKLDVEKKLNLMKSLL